MRMADETKKPTYVDDLSVRETYAEAFQVFFRSPEILRLEFAVNRITQEPPVKVDRVVPVARLALTRHNAEMLRDELTRVLEAQQNMASGERLENAAGSPVKH